PIPSRAMPRAGVRSRSSPQNLIAPLSGWYRRLTQLNSVVLPAPLGPISPAIVPSSTLSEARSRAVTPPNVIVSSSTSSTRVPQLLGCLTSAARQRAGDLLPTDRVSRRVTLLLEVISGNRYAPSRR